MRVQLQDRVTELQEVSIAVRVPPPRSPASRLPRADADLRVSVFPGAGSPGG